MISPEIQTFLFSDAEIRTIISPSGEIYFVASDVCKVLAIGNVSDAVSRLDSDERNDLVLTDSVGKPNKFIIINESGLYSLVLSSRKAEARVFKKWVTSEVLPAIRRTGKYEIGGLSALRQTVETLENHEHRIKALEYYKALEQEAQAELLRNPENDKRHLERLHASPEALERGEALAQRKEFIRLVHAFARLMGIANEDAYLLVFDEVCAVLGVNIYREAYDMRTLEYLHQQRLMPTVLSIANELLKGGAR